MKVFIGLLLGLLLGLVGWLVLSSSRFAPATAPVDGVSSPVNATADSVSGLSQRVEPMDLTGPFTFAGEPIPVEDFDVRERLDLELMRNAYFHRSTLLLLKRRARYFPTIERILREEGVPDDLKYLAAAESNLAQARSPAGARGVWQFMAPTARSYGLTVNEEVDERNHLEKSTRAAARYLKDYYEKYGDWRLVAAAYNMGGPNLDRWRDRQRAESIFDLDINAETMGYLFRIVAIKTILEDPQAFGYYVEPEEQYAPLTDVRTVTVTQSLPNLGDFARAQGTTYRKLKLYNPWLMGGSLTVRGGQAYTLKLPPER